MLLLLIDKLIKLNCRSLSLASLDFPKLKGIVTVLSKSHFLFFCDMKNVKLNLMSREEPSANRKHLTKNENNFDTSLHELYQSIDPPLCCKEWPEVLILVSRVSTKTILTSCLSLFRPLLSCHSFALMLIWTPSVVNPGCTKKITRT